MRVASHLAIVTPAEGAPGQSVRPSLWLALTDEEGRVGVGEASPLPPFSRETVEMCAEALARAGERLGDLALVDRAPATELVTDACQRLGPALDLAPAARFALETALLDLIGQRRGCSIAACLGGPRSYTEVPVNALLIPPTDSSDEAARAFADRAEALADAGYPAIKIKLRARDDAAFARELALLRAVRDRLPPPFELRLDPNAAWPLDVARARLAALAPLAARFVEQPVAPDDLAALGPAAVPWAADESLARPALVPALLASKGCTTFVLKPHVLGLLRARELALLALAHGLDVVITHFFDGPIAIAAACELALSLPRPPLACGLDLHDLLPAWPAIAIPQLGSRTRITPSAAPGLGLTFDPEQRAWML